MGLPTLGNSGMDSGMVTVYYITEQISVNTRVIMKTICHMDTVASHGLMGPILRASLKTEDSKKANIYSPLEIYTRVNFQ